MGTYEMTEPLYVCVYVPQFPAQALLRLRPELAGKPVAVLAGDPPLEQVCSLSAQARRLGIVPGMTRAELDSFLGVCVLRRSEAEEHVARSVLLEMSGGFTPRVELQPSSMPMLVLVLDMTGTTRIFGSPAQVVGRIVDALKKLHIHAQLAASANFHAAICLASVSLKTPAIVPAGQEQEFLSTLPLSALGLTPQEAETLSLWGLRSLGELAKISEVELVVRLGQEGKRLRRLARGEQPHLMVPEEPVSSLEEFIAFDAPVELLDSLLFVLGPMLDQLLARSQSRALALASVTVRLELDGGTQHERTIKPALPVMQRDVLMKLIHLDLRAHPPPAGVLSVFVHAEPGDRSKVQLGLFAPQMPEPLRLEVTLARVAALVGEKRVGKAKLLDSHRSCSFTMERFVVPPVAAKLETSPRATAALRRCRPPVPLSVWFEGQQLAALSFHGKRYVVQEAYGPWRNSGEWWSKNVWSGEEWDVCASAGAEDTLLCVLMHDLVRHQWQMEALYD